MLIEFLIMLQIAVVLVFVFGYMNKSFEAMVITIILASIVGFSYYNIEVGETRPTIIDSTNPIITIEYEKITTVYQNYGLAWLNIGIAVISLILFFWTIFNNFSMDVISWLRQ